MARYAIYFAPAADSALWQFGSAVLGYDASSGEELRQIVPPQMTAGAWHTATAQARRYGFHATLKAPFRLAEARTADDLVAALDEFCASLRPFDLTLRLVTLDGFIALMPQQTPPALTDLEHRTVEAFEPFRAPLNEAEMARRLRSPLTARQAYLLSRYGYPYVHDEFRFHMTLSDRLSEPGAGQVRSFLAQEFAARAAPTVTIDRLALFEERDGRFVRFAEHGI